VTRRVKNGGKACQKILSEGIQGHWLTVLGKAREKLVESGYRAENLDMELISEPYPAVADGIVERCMKRNCTMVVLGRKRMSEGEEFVMGYVGVKLARSLEKAAVLVVKAQ
jgi:K+-sensing histidine kinase KdpD